MKSKFNLILIGFLFLILTRAVFAVEPLPANLVSLNSRPGLILFKRDMTLNSLKLLSHFTTQETVTYCGVASVVMVLNATNKTPPLDSIHTPYHYFNQVDFFNADVKQIISPEEVQKKGIDLLTLSKIVTSYGLDAKPFHANQLTLEKFRELLAHAIANQQFVIVNFLRSALGQQGGGHHSPIAAYDKKTDQFLLLDVARYKYPAYWVKTATLWKAVNTKDKSGYRGVILIREK